MYRNKISKTQPRDFSIRSRKFNKEIATCIFLIEIRVTLIFFFTFAQRLM